MPHRVGRCPADAHVRARSLDRVRLGHDDALSNHDGSSDVRSTRPPQPPQHAPRPRCRSRCRHRHRHHRAPRRPRVPLPVGSPFAPIRRPEALSPNVAGLVYQNIDAQAFGRRSAWQPATRATAQRIYQDATGSQPAAVEHPHLGAAADPGRLDHLPDQRRVPGPADHRDQQAHAVQHRRPGHPADARRSSRASRRARAARSPRRSRCRTRSCSPPTRPTRSVRSAAPARRCSASASGTCRRR